MQGQHSDFMMHLFPNNASSSPYCFDWYWKQSWWHNTRSYCCLQILFLNAYSLNLMMLCINFRQLAQPFPTTHKNYPIHKHFYSYLWIAFPFLFIILKETVINSQPPTHWKMIQKNRQAPQDRSYGTQLVFLLYTEIWPSIPAFCFPAFSQSFTEIGNSLY